MRPYSHAVLNSSVSSSTYSDIVDLQHFTFVSYQVTVKDGTVAGTTNLQLSNDGVNFIDDSTTSKAFSGVGSTITQAIDVAVKYVRVKVTVSSGSSNMTITLVSKGNS
jgi:hypothetical protein